MWIWSLFPRVRLWYHVYKVYPDGRRQHVSFERYHQGAFTDQVGKVDRRRRSVTQGLRFEVVSERTNWWRHRQGWRFVGGSIQQCISKGVAKTNSALDTGLGKVIAAIVIGTTVWLLTKYLAPHLGIN